MHAVTVCGVAPLSTPVSVVVLVPWTMPEAKLWPEELSRWRGYAGKHFPEGAVELLPARVYRWLRRVQGDFIGRLLVPAWTKTGRPYFAAAYRCGQGDLVVAVRQSEIEKTVELARMERERELRARRAAPDRPRVKRVPLTRYVARPCGGCGKRRRARMKTA